MRGIGHMTEKFVDNCPLLSISREVAVTFYIWTYSSRLDSRLFLTNLYSYLHLLYMLSNVIQLSTVCTATTTSATDVIRVYLNTSISIWPCDGNRSTWWSSAVFLLSLSGLPFETFPCGCQIIEKVTRKNRLEKSEQFYENQQLQINPRVQ